MRLIFFVSFLFSQFANAAQISKMNGINFSSYLWEQVISGDGRFSFYQSGYTLYQLDFSTGQSKKIADNFLDGLSVSYDGSKIAFVPYRIINNKNFVVLDLVTMKAQYFEIGDES